VDRHVLAKVRREAGLLQKELAQRVSVSAVTIKKIESLERTLTEAMARKIGESLGVSHLYLLRNDLHRRPVTEKGEPWDAKTFFNLKPESLEGRFIDLLVTSALFTHYRRCRGSLRRFKNPLFALNRLETLVDRAYHKFLKEYPESAKGDSVTLLEVIADANAHIHSKLSDEVIDSLLERDLGRHGL